MEFKGKWIPVSERFPDTYGTHLITIERDGTFEVYVGEFDPDSRHIGFHEWVEGSFAIRTIENVVAWAELPKAYKTKEGVSL